MITVKLPPETTTDYPSVITIFLLETLLTGMVFAGFWAASTQEFPTMVPSILVAAPVVLAPITGIGEQQMNSDHLMAD